MNRQRGKRPLRVDDDVVEDNYDDDNDDDYDDNDNDNEEDDSRSSSSSNVILQNEMIKNSLMPQKKRKLQYDSDDDNNSTDYDFNTAMVVSKPQQRAGNNKTMKLPGGVGHLVGNPCSKTQIASTSSGIGELKRNLTKGIRDYMDILFSSIMIEANLNCQRTRESIHAIPGVVNAILEYNNISFKTIELTKTTHRLFEPIVYYYDIINSKLNLFVNESMYDTFCMKNEERPVVYSGGVIPVEIFNPFATPPTVTDIDSAMIHCAIICDHVAQHIISDIFDEKNPCADIHDNFTRMGTTLHSIFKLEQNSTPNSKLEYSNYLTLGNYNAPSHTSQSTHNLLSSMFPQPTSDNYANFNFSL